jgi:tetratricopeptide (TPR) repeat protein
MDMGARDVPGMLALAERALDPGNHQYKLKEKYESGERSAKVVRGYLSMVEDEDKRREIMAGYVERLDAQAMSKEDKALVLENIEETDGPAFDFVLSHLRQFEGEEVEGMRVKELIVYLYTMDLGGLYLEEGGKGTEEMLAKAEEKAPGLAPSLHAMDRMLAVYVETEDPEQTYEQVLEDMDVLDDKYITMMFAISMFEDMGRRKNLIDIAAGEASPETMKKLYSDEIYRAKEVNPELMNELVGESAETYFWDDAASLNDFAWFMLDYPDQVGDYDLVLRMAERSVELDEDHYSLDTYARALYETGEKQKAVRMQEKAVRMAENDPEVSEAYVEGLQTALEKYKQ